MTSEPDDLRNEQGSAEALFAGWAVRVENGETLAFEDLVNAHPANAEELSKLHEDWKLFAPLLGKVVPGLIASSTGINVAPLSGGDEDDPGMPCAELLDRLGIHAPNTGRYRFRSVLGRGGGGVVLKVWDTKLNRPLAMKVVLGRGENRPSGDTPKVDSRTLTRFVDEARIASQLNHPGIVPVHELGADESGRAFFTMKLVKGEDLSRIFQKVKSGEDGWTQTRALGVLLKVCEAMSFAHAKGVVHRDLKPANIMVGRYGEVYVMDWGLARVLGEKAPRDIRICALDAPSEMHSVRTHQRNDGSDAELHTMDGDVIGTPAYMSPEQAHGHVDHMGPHSDVYALGAMLYHLITGSIPYVTVGEAVHNYAIWAQVQAGPPVPAASITPTASPELVAICDKSMARDWRNRYTDMGALAVDVASYLEGRVVSAYEAGAVATLRKWLHRNKVLATSSAITIVALFAGTIISTFLYIQARAERDVAQDQRRHAQYQTFLVSIHAAQDALERLDISNAKRLLDAIPHHLRDWEWDHLNSDTDHSLLVLPHGSKVWSAALHPSGRQIITGCEDAIARVWDATGVLRSELIGHRFGVTSAVFSADGTRVLTGSWDGHARLWRSDGSLLAVMSGHKNAVTSAMFGAGDARIITSSWDTTARLWDGSTGKNLGILSGHTLQLSSARLSPDGIRAITTSDDGTARLWDMSSHNEVAVLSGHDRRITSTAFSPDSAFVSTASDDGTVRSWNAMNGVERCILKGHSGPVRCVTYSIDGTRIVTASDDATGRIWSALTGEELQLLQGTRSGLSYAIFSPDGSRVATASADKSLRLWDAYDGRVLAVLKGHTGRITSISFHPNGQYLVTSSEDGSSRLWSTEIPILPPPLYRHECKVRRTTISPDGTDVLTDFEDGTTWLWSTRGSTSPFLLETRTHSSLGWFSANSARLLVTSSKGGYSLWDVHNRTVLAELGTDRVTFPFPRFNIDGTRLLTQATAETTRLLDPYDGSEVALLRGHTKAITSALFSPNGSLIITGSDDGTARLWSAMDGALLGVLEGHTRELMLAEFSASGTTVVTASRDGAVRLWEVLSGRQTCIVQQRPGNGLHAILSPDGGRLATILDRDAVRLWDARTGQPIAALSEAGRTLLRPDGSFWSMLRAQFAFSPDGSLLVTAKHDVLSIWDAASGVRLRELRGHQSVILGFAFDNTGSRLLTNSQDGTARLWDMSTGAELLTLCEDANPIQSASYSADDSLIIVVLEDGTIKTFDSVSIAARSFADGQMKASMRR